MKRINLPIFPIGESLFFLLKLEMYQYLYSYIICFMGNIESKMQMFLKFSTKQCDPRTKWLRCSQSPRDNLK